MIHTYIKTSNGAICEGPVTFTYTCSACDDCYVVNFDAMEHDWSEATCRTPQMCKLCRKTEGYPLGCTYDFDNRVITGNICTGYGSITDICVRCGVPQKTYYSNIGHSWLEASCAEPMTCEYCDTQYGEPNGHVWIETSCIAVRKCDICGATDGEHHWLDATCFESKRCEFCGASDGYPLDHVYVGDVIEPTCGQFGYTQYLCIM